MNAKTNRTTFITTAKAARDAVATGQTMLVACVLLTVDAGPFEPADLVAAGYPESSAKSYASQWNLGDKAAGLIGDKAARETIEATAAKSATRAYEAVLAVLRNLRDAAEAHGVEVKKGGAVKVPTKAVGLKIARAASAMAAEKADARKAAKGPSGQQAPTMASVREELAKLANWADVARVALALSHAVQELPADDDRAGACNDAKRCAAALAEATAPFRVKRVSK